MIDMESFKDQVLDFIEDREEPFDRDFLVRNCNWPVDDDRVHDALCQLSNEGLIVRLDGYRYNQWLSTRVLMRRWLKPLQDPQISLPRNLIQQIRELLSQRPDLGYADVDNFVRDAIRRFIQRLK